MQGPRLDVVHTSFIAIDEAIFAVLDTWPPEWRRLDAVGRDETIIQKQKVEAKCVVQQKRNEQYVAQVKAV